MGVHPIWPHVLPLPCHQLLLLLFALGRQPLLLHVLLHRNTDGAGGALALLVMLQQLSGSHTPAKVGGTSKSCRACLLTDAEEGLHALRCGLCGELQPVLNTHTTIMGVDC